MGVLATSLIYQLKYQMNLSSELKSQVKHIGALLSLQVGFNRFKIFNISVYFGVS